MTINQPYCNNDETKIQIIKETQLEQKESSSSSSSNSNNYNSIQLPSWANPSHCNKWGDRLHFSEWDDYDDGNDNHNSDSSTNKNYRKLNGWKGNDLIHSYKSPVRVLEYRLSYFSTTATTTTSITTTATTSTSNNYNNNTKLATLTGIVHFTPQSESHQGYCHGGSMCSVMDDIIGWTGFCSTGTCIPWSGYTVQVNTKLCKPIFVGSVLKIVCRVREEQGEDNYGGSGGKRRKVWVDALLFDPKMMKNEDDYENVNDVDCCSKTMDELRTSLKSCIHAQGEGLVILNKDVTI